MIKALVAAGFLALNFYVYHHLATEELIPERTSFEHFPLDLDEWSCRAPLEIEEKVIANLGVTDYLVCDFVRAETHELVGAYVGYHETQVRREGGGSGENSIHPPKHCLPGSGWSIMEHEIVPLQ